MIVQVPRVESGSGFIKEEQELRLQARISGVNRWMNQKTIPSLRALCRRWFASVA